MKGISTRYFILHSALIAAIIIYLFAGSKQEDRTAYILSNEVFEEFTLTQELEGRLDQLKNRRQAELDSMRLHLEIEVGNLQKNNDPDPERIRAFEQRREAYLLRQQQYEKDNEALLAQYKEQISKQINQYVQDFGKANGYRYIYGANGSGTLMFADEGHDVTREVIDYLNREYQGGTAL